MRSDVDRLVAALRELEKTHSDRVEAVMEKIEERDKKDWDKKAMRKTWHGKRYASRRSSNSRWRH